MAELTEEEKKALAEKNSAKAQKEQEKAAAEAAKKAKAETDAEAAKKAEQEKAAAEAEAEAARVKRFSELSYKTPLVIENANGTETQVTKAYWQSVKNAELDRLQGIKLLGLYVAKKDGYSVVEIIDDSEVEEM